MPDVNEQEERHSAHVHPFGWHGWPAGRPL